MTQPTIDNTIDPIPSQGIPNLVNLAPAQESKDGDIASEPNLLPTPPQDSFKDAASDFSLPSTVEREEVIVNEVNSPTPVPPHPVKLQKGDPSFAQTKFYPKTGEPPEKKDSPPHKANWREKRHAGSDKSSNSSTHATDISSPVNESKPKQSNKLPKDVFAMDLDDSRDVDADASNSQSRPLLPETDPDEPYASDPRDQNPGPSTRQDAPDPDGDDDPIVKKLRQQLWEQSLQHKWEMDRYTQHINNMQQSYAETLSRDQADQERMRQLLSECQFENNSQKAEFRHVMSQLEGTRAFDSEAYQQQLYEMTEKMQQINRTEHGLYHLAEGHLMQIRGECYSELEMQKAQYLADQKVKNRLEVSVQAASQVCNEYSSRLTEVSNDLGERN